MDLNKREKTAGTITLLFLVLGLANAVAGTIAIQDDAIYMNNEPIVGLESQSLADDPPTDQGATVGYVDEAVDDVDIEGEEFTYNEFGSGVIEDLGDYEFGERDFYKIPMKSPVPTGVNYLEDEGDITVNVVSTNMDFGPREIEVPKDEEITFIYRNQDDTTHNMEFVDDGTGTDNLDPDEREHFTRTFTDEGEYDFTCTLHSDMEGTVIVEDVG